jgi:hypothetical protein
VSSFLVYPEPRGATRHVLPLSRRSDVKTCKRSDDLRARHSLVPSEAEGPLPLGVIPSPVAVFRKWGRGIRFFFASPLGVISARHLSLPRRALSSPIRAGARHRRFRAAAGMSCPFRSAGFQPAPFLERGKFTPTPVGASLPPSPRLKRLCRNWGSDLQVRHNSCHFLTALAAEELVLRLRHRLVSAGCVIYKTRSTGGAARVWLRRRRKNLQGSSRQRGNHFSPLVTSSSPHPRPARPPRLRLKVKDRTLMKYQMPKGAPPAGHQCSQYFLKLGMRFRAVGLVAVRFERKADAPKVQ